MNLLLLDMTTIFIVLVFGHVFSVVLISTYWRDHRKDHTLTTFFTAKCIQSLAWLFLAIRGGIPDVLTICIGNSLLFLGVSLEAIALLKYLRKYTPAVKKFYIYFTAFTIIGFHLVILIQNEEHYRVAFASLATAAIVILPAYAFMLEKKSSLFIKVMGALYLFVAISFLARGFIALLSDHNMGLFTPGAIQSVSFVMLFLTMFLGNTGFILLLKERADEELIRLASYDDLTTALNRRTFTAQAKQLIVEHAKLKQPISMILFDIDNFKDINDKNGHDIGDKVLIDLSQRIKGMIAENQLFVRYGGDEFALFLPGLDVKSSDKLAEKIRKEIEQNVRKTLFFTYTLSMGVRTMIPDEKTNLHTIYVSCDKALYVAKQKGKNGVVRSA